MRLILPFLLAATVSVSQAQSVSAAWATECEARLPSTQISVVVDAGSVVYNRSRSVAELTARSTDRSFGSKTTVLGLTEATTGVGIRTNETQMAKPGESLSCMRPALEVTLSIPSHVVSVAREFPPGTCAYNQVLAHEMRHVAVNTNSLSVVASELRSELAASFGNRVFYGTPQELREALGAHLKRDWTPWVDARLAHYRERHKEIDTPGELLRTQTACGDEVARRLGWAVKPQS